MSVASSKQAGVLSSIRSRLCRYLLSSQRGKAYSTKETIKDPCAFSLMLPISQTIHHKKHKSWHLLDDICADRNNSRRSTRIGRWLGPDKASDHCDVPEDLSVVAAVRDGLSKEQPQFCLGVRLGLQGGNQALEAIWSPSGVQQVLHHARQHETLQTRESSVK